MLLVLASSTDVRLSFDWRWRSPQEDQIQHSLFQSERVGYPRLEIGFNGWVANLGLLYYFSYYDPLYEDDVEVVFWDLTFGRRFKLPLGFEITPWAGAGFSRASSLSFGVENGEVKSYEGLAFLGGADLAWGLPSVRAKLLTTGGYRVIPGWFPGSLHHQWELGLGLRFNVWGE